MFIAKPKISELSDYYKSYLQIVPENDLLTALEDQVHHTTEFLKGISDLNSIIAYERCKWQLKEVIGHLCDSERILTYRALRFSRKDETPLAGFEENDYIHNSNFKVRSWASIREEKKIISEASLIFFKTLDESAYDLTGLANGNNVSVRSLLFFVLAHERHHLRVVEERYLKKN